MVSSCCCSFILSCQRPLRTMSRVRCAQRAVFGVHKEFVINLESVSQIIMVYICIAARNRSSLPSRTSLPA